MLKKASDIHIHQSANIGGHEKNYFTSLHYEIQIPQTVIDQMVQIKDKGTGQVAFVSMGNIRSFKLKEENEPGALSTDNTGSKQKIRN